MQKQSRSTLTILWALLLAAGLILCSASACAASFSDDPDAIEEAARSVLMLKIYDQQSHLTATGSGFVMFDNRTLVTNYHVIDDASLIIAEDDTGEKYILEKVIIQDEAKDIAILQFLSPTAMEPLPFSTAPVKRGSKVVAIGSPIGLKNTVSMGNVSASYQEDGVTWIQFTAPISHGSSGGAVFDNSGRVIGVSSATYTDGQNLNLAISIADVIALYKQWDGYNGQADQEQTDEEFSDWIAFDATLMNVLYEKPEEVLESDSSRLVGMACAILDYELAEAPGPEIGGGLTYYIAQDEESLVICCPLVENDQGMQSAVLLYFFEDATYSMLSVDQTLEYLVAALSDDAYTFYSMDNDSVVEALNLLLDAILEEE